MFKIGATVVVRQGTLPEVRGLRCDSYIARTVTELADEYKVRKAGLKRAGVWAVGKQWAYKQNEFGNTARSVERDPSFARPSPRIQTKLKHEATVEAAVRAKKLEKEPSKLNKAKGDEEKRHNARIKAETWPY